MTRLSKFNLEITTANGTHKSSIMSNASPAVVKDLTNELLRCLGNGSAYVLNCDDGQVIFPGPLLQNSVISLVKVSDEDR